MSTPPKVSAPRVSVLMPVFNTPAEYLRAAVASVLHQSFAEFELVIVDDGGGAAAANLLAGFAAADNRIRLLTLPENVGITKALNAGLAECSGELIARMDSDDIAEPQRLAVQVKFMQAHPEVGLCGSNIYVLQNNARRKQSPRKEFVKLVDLLQRNEIMQSTVVVRKSVLTAAGGYDEFFAVAEDYDLWCRLAKVTKLVNLPDYLLTHRAHSDSATAKNYTLMAKLALYIQRYHSGEITAAAHAELQTQGLAAVHNFMQTNFPAAYHQRVAAANNRHHNYAAALHHYQQLWKLGKRDWKVVRNLISLRFKK